MAITEAFCFVLPRAYCRTYWKLRASSDGCPQTQPHVSVSVTHLLRSPGDGQAVVVQRLFMSGQQGIVPGAVCTRDPHPELVKTASDCMTVSSSATHILPLFLSRVSDLHVGLSVPPHQFQLLTHVVVTGTTPSKSPADAPVPSCLLRRTRPTQKASILRIGTSENVSILLFVFYISYSGKMPC